MKTIMKLFLLVLCGAFAATTSFGQTLYTWTGGGDGTNLDLPANWGGTAPSAANSDIGSFNGSVPGNLYLNYSLGVNGNFPSGPGSSAVSIQLTSSQTGNVSINNLTTTPSNPNLALYDVQVQSGAGVFALGDNNVQLNFAGRPGGVVHSFDNESANTDIIGDQLHYVAGGGAAYAMQFTGTGDWIVNSWLTTDNGVGVWFDKEGTGTTTWNPVGYSGGTGGIIGVNVGGGTLILTAPISKINNAPVTNNATFIFNAPSQSQNLAGLISGTGTLIVTNGTLTLSDTNIYTGDTILAGGILAVNGDENDGVSGPLGVGGSISFNGGTLQFSAVNTFDYSPRFNKTASGQAVNIDTAGQNVTFTNGLASSGGTLTKLGPGTLTLAGANTYDGLTTINAGKLVFQGTAGAGNITVGNSTALGATGGSQIQPSVLAVGTSGGAALEFNNVTSTSTPLIAAGTISAPAPITVNVNGGTFADNQDYPLFSWGGGSVPAVSLGTVIGATGNLNTNGSMIRLHVTALAYTWNGLTNGNWDAATEGNWLVGGGPVVYSDPNPVLFDDTAAGATNVTVNATVQPANVTINNNTKTYSIASTGVNRISGTASLSKVGNGTLTLSGGVNDYSGITSINGGTASVGVLANGGTASDIGAASSAAANLVLNGGTLEYTGAGATSDHLFTLGTAGGRIRSDGFGTLILSNGGVIGLLGSGARTLTLNSSNITSGDTLAGVLGDSGGATAVTKTGPGTWILTGNNTNSGLITISAGTLQIGAGGGSGTLGGGDVVDSAVLDFNRTGTLTVNGNIGGTGRLTNDGAGTVILNGNNTYSGGTFINAGTLQFGTGGAGGTIFGNAPVTMTNNSTVIFDSTTPINISGFGDDISGPGNVIVRAGSVTGGDGNGVTYTGWTEIDAGATFQPCTGQTVGFLSSSVTNNGSLVMVSQNSPATFGISNNIVGTGRIWMDTRNQNAGYGTLSGNDTYTGGTFIGGGGIVIGDGLTAGTGSIVGSVVFTNTTGPFVSLFNTSKRLLLDRPDTFTFTNDLISAVSDGSTAANSGSLEQMLGTVTITGNNNYPGDTTVDAGATLQAGNGGTSGSIGSGDKVINGTLVFDRSASDTINGVVSGAGSLVQQGTGTLTLTNNNTFTGNITVSNGVLVINGADASASTTVVGGTFGGAGTLAGSVTTASGTTLVPGASGSVGTLTINNTLDIGGNVAVDVNEALAQSNDMMVVSGTLTKTGSGTLTVSNLGSTLHVGDKFTLFSQPLANGGAMTVTGGGATWQNDLATDGSISVLTITSVTQPTLNFTHTGNNLQFSWTTSGYKLQSQTNSLSVGISTNWSDYPGGGVSGVTVPVDPTKGTVFFRLAPTP